MEAKIGDVMKARVNRIETYGLFLSCNSIDIYVKIVDLSWREPVDPHSFCKKGDVFDVLIIGYLSKNMMIGSIKDVHPEDDPWSDCSIYTPGLRYSAVIKKKRSFGFFVSLPNGVEAFLRSDKENHTLNIGEVVNVEIVDSDKEHRKLTVRLV